MRTMCKPKVEPVFERKPFVAHLFSACALSICLGFAATAEGALPYQIPYAEDFEAPLTNNMPVEQIGVWQAGPTDASKIVAESYSFTASTRPIDPSADLQVLQLDTQADAVTNFFDIADSDQVLYMDSMLNLSPRSDIPESVTNDPTVQLFFYMNADTNLVVYNGGVDGASPSMTVIPGALAVPGEWNRYTVTMDYLTAGKYFKLQVNGLDVTCAQAYSAPGGAGAFDGGAWFFAVDQTGPDTIDSVEFQGAGNLDDFVMTTSSPTFTTAVVYYVVSELLGSGTVSPVEAIEVLSGSSTQVVYQANMWHEISDFEQDGLLVPGAIGEQVYTAVFANVQADISNLVTFAETVADVDGKTPATWYGPLGADPSQVDEDDDGLTLFEEYLINSHPVIVGTFVIASDNLGDPMPSVSWESLGLPNGTVDSEVSTNLLQGTWVPIAGTLSHDGSTTTWQATEAMPDEDAAFLRVQVVE